MTDDERRHAQKRARAKRYRQRHPERARQRWQAWIAKNRERRAAYMATWNAEHADERRAYQQAYHAENRRARRLAKYGLTEAAYDAMVAAQGGRCAVCRRTPRYELVPDHDHATGQLRGLLCHGCNAGIGYLGDTVEAVERALEYLIAARREAARWAA